MICEICQIGDADVRGYGDAVCDHCKQRYPYDEGQYLALEPIQLEILRAFYRMDESTKATMICLFDIKPL